VVDFSRHGGPSKSPYAANLSKLNDQLQLRANISQDDIRTWTKLAAAPASSRTKARASSTWPRCKWLMSNPKKHRGFWRKLVGRTEEVQRTRACEIGPRHLHVSRRAL